MVKSPTQLMDEALKDFKLIHTVATFTKFQTLKLAFENELEWLDGFIFKDKSVHWVNRRQQIKQAIYMAEEIR